MDFGSCNPNPIPELTDAQLCLGFTRCGESGLSVTADNLNAVMKAMQSGASGVAPPTRAGVIEGRHVNANVIFTTGALAVGDGGEASYFRDAEQTPLTTRGSALAVAAIGRGQEANSANSAIAEMESRFRPKDVTGLFFRAERRELPHAAYALSGEAPRATIQAMLDLATHWGISTGYVDSGQYAADGPIWVTRGDEFRQNHFHGTGRRYFGFNNSTGVSIRFTDPGQPGVIAQGYRGSRIYDLTILGAGVAAHQAAGLGGLNPVNAAGEPIDDYEVAAWAIGGLTHRRHSPHAGIVLDPFTGTVPPGPYAIPDANPAWFGPLSLYGRVASSESHLDVDISGFEVGLMINPSQNVFQTDFTTGSRLQITYCTYAVSIGDQQARQNNFPSFNFANVHTVFTNEVHGVQAGRFQGEINPVGGSALRLLNISIGEAGALTINGGYTETLHSLGDVSDGPSGQGALLFNNAEYGLGNHPARRGYAPYILGNPVNPGAGISSANIVFNAGNFSHEESLPILANTFDFNGKIVLLAVQNGWWESGSGHPLAIVSDAERRRRKLASNGTLGLFTPSMRVSEGHKIIGSVLDVDAAGNIPADVKTNDSAYRLTQRRYGIPHWQKSAQPSGYTQDNVGLREMPRRTGSLALSQISGLSRTGKRWTFTLPAYLTSASEYVARNENIAPGRACIDDQAGTAFWVVGVDYATGAVVIEQLSNFYTPVGASVPQPRIPLALDVGNLVFAETAFFMPAFTMIGDVSAGSATVTNLRDPNGGAGWLTNPAYVPTNPQAGDWLYYDPLDTRDAPFTAAGAEVVTFDPAGATMMMSGPAVFNRTGVDFSLFRRGD